MKNNFFRVIITGLSLLILFSCGEDKPKQETQTTTEASKPMVPAPLFNSDSAYKYVEQQVAFGPRVPNTPAHQKCGSYLIAKLKSFADTVTVQEFQAKAFDGKMLNLKNIKASFNLDAPKRILLASHWDSRPFADQDSVNPRDPILGANDGASGVGILIEIARLLHENKRPNVGVDIILFDGEDYGQPDFYQGPQQYDSWCLGSQYWSKNKGSYTAYFGILLDMVGGKDAKFGMEGTSMKYAPTVVKKVWDIANKLGFGKYFIYQQTAQITDDHLYVNQLAKIPMIDIIEYDDSDGNYFGSYWHTHNDNMDVIDKATLNAVGQTVLQTVYEE
jgi:glutaminyl-peptide cyclotransferase